MNRALSFWVLMLLGLSKVDGHPTVESNGIIVEVLHSSPELLLLEADSTVDDALQAVGLPGREIRTVLSNGDSVLVTPSGVSLKGSERAIAMGERLALNSASEFALDTIPGIGPVRAAAIVRSREDEGPFKSVEDLDRVHGIGPSTVKKIESFVRAL